jgi:hypothetical protein
MAGPAPRLHINYLLVCLFGVMIGFIITNTLGRGSSNAVPSKPHELARLQQEIAMLQNQVMLSQEEMRRVLEADKEINITLVTNNRGRGKNLRILIDNAATLLKYENPLPPPAPDIDKVKERFAVIPKELLDFDSFEPKFMETWARLGGLINECKDSGGYPEKNNMVSMQDYCVAYSFMRAFQPKLVIEVGSGYSTRAIYNALQANKVAGIEPAQQVRFSSVRACLHVRM